MNNWKTRQDKQLEKEKRMFYFLNEHYEFQYQMNTGIMFFSERGKNDFKHFDSRAKNNLYIELILNGISVSKYGLNWCANLLAKIFLEN